MSDIYNKHSEELDGGRWDSTHIINEDDNSPIKEDQAVRDPVPVPTAPGIDMREYIQQSEAALRLVDSIVNKSYLSKLYSMHIIEQEMSLPENIILFKVKKMVYDKEENATEKFISAVSAMTFTASSVFLVIDSEGNNTDFYLGVLCEDDTRTSSSIAEAFSNALKGQFPGIVLENVSVIEKGSRSSGQEKVISRIRKASTVSSYTGVPSRKSEDSSSSNEKYVQGIEKMVEAMRGRNYTAVIVAHNCSNDEIVALRRAYEQLYTQLSGQAVQQLSYSTNESLSNALNRTKGYSDSVSEGTTHSSGTTESHNVGETHQDSTSENKTKSNFWGKTLKVAGPITQAGLILTSTGAGAPAGLALLGIGTIASIAGTLGEGSNSKGEQHSDGTNISTGQSVSNNEGTTHNETHQEQFSETSGRTSSVGSSKNFTITVHNKRIEEVLKRIDKHLQRIEKTEESGLWQSGAYFLSYENDRSSAEIGASIYRAIMQGSGSGVEMSAINSWYSESGEASEKDIKILTNTISSFKHPLFSYESETQSSIIPVSSSSLLSSAELAMIIGLPRKSVPGLPIIEFAPLAKEVVKYSSDSSDNTVDLGCILDYGVEYKNTRVRLNLESFSQHVFVTGSTGCGKSETVYKLIDELGKSGIAFLVIEPAKGEYKKVFGNASVYGTNPKFSTLLKINPFRFPEGVHVLEHIDRLVEIFNVCWPMYAAMPVVLKKAILSTYTICGWDLMSSTNSNDFPVFPNFNDLLLQLKETINESAYSEEVKSNYTGSLVTRVESLTNGINGEILCSGDIDDKDLFDKNVIVDLSRIGSVETKSLLMGLLIMRLNEHRMTQCLHPNSNLKHVTILEEAHNILPKTSTFSGSDSGNLVGKSVEMITNAIAEMRTYGEGFIIVDQSPTSVSISAIKNTNTKIIMRLPDMDDRLIAGKSASMKDIQIDEISKLPTGAAVLYQNDWVEPVLCRIDQYVGQRIEYSFDEKSHFNNSKEIKGELLRLLLQETIPNEREIDINFILRNINSLRLSTQSRQFVLSLIDRNGTNASSILSKTGLRGISKIVIEIIGNFEEVTSIVMKANDFKELDHLLTQKINKVARLSEPLNLSVRQCLMLEFGEKNDTCKAIYKKWYLEIIDKHNDTYEH